MSRYGPKNPTKREIALSMATWAMLAPPGKVVPNVVIPPAPIKRRQSVPSNIVPEHDHQKEVVRWWGLQGPAWGYPKNALYAIPNSQALIKYADNPHAFMAYLRAEGFRDGVLDLNLDIPFGEWHGLRLEMKRETKAVTSEEQLEYVRMYHQLGYAAGIHHGAASAISAIRHYLGKA